MNVRGGSSKEHVLTVGALCGFLLLLRSCSGAASSGGSSGLALCGGLPDGQPLELHASEGRPRGQHNLRTEHECC